MYLPRTKELECSLLEHLLKYTCTTLHFGDRGDSYR